VFAAEVLARTRALVRTRILVASGAVEAAVLSAEIRLCLATLARIARCARTVESARQVGAGGAVQACCRAIDSGRTFVKLNITLLTGVTAGTCCNLKMKF
jgi:hypothetical protein